MCYIQCETCSARETVPCLYNGDNSFYECRTFELSHEKLSSCHKPCSKCHCLKDKFQFVVNQPDLCFNCFTLEQFVGDQIKPVVN